MSDMEEEYEFEYSSEDEEEEDVNIENQYYNAKAVMENNPNQAINEFQEVVGMEKEKSEWGFKALKQIVKLQFQAKNYEQVMKKYNEMLTYIKSAVTRNYSEKVINSILDFVSSSNNMDLLHEFYETTLQFLQDAKNDRLWFKTNLKLGKLWFDMEEYGRLNKILKELHKSCQNTDGTDDLKKGTQLLEVYALEIQLYTATKNNKKLKALYEKSLQVKSAIPHPRIMGVIRECGGKMHMGEREWVKARSDFFEAFKNYDEAGSERRINCLKYLVLANMLMNSEISPFDSQETKPYKNDNDIIAMTNLVNAYMNNDIKDFEKILESNRKSIMDDPFIRNYIEDLLKNIRTQVLLKLLKPYTRVKIPFISSVLNIPEKDVEDLLVSLILDNLVNGRIDQVNKIVIMGTGNDANKKYDGITKWATELKNINTHLMNKATW